MSLNAVSFRNRLNEKWGQRLNRREKSQKDKCLPHLKLQIVCKCPRCEKEHDVNLQWAGRGKPRIFCPTCRPTVAAINDAVWAKRNTSRPKGTLLDNC